MSIRWKLALACVGVACFVAAFVVVAIAIQFHSNERAAILEATNVAELIAAWAQDRSTSGTALQDDISKLTAIRKRDFVVVDARQRGVADADPQRLEWTYNSDLADEVGKTIKDRSLRPPDLMARWGGEGFLLLPPDSSERQAIQVSCACSNA